MVNDKADAKPRWLEKFVKSLYSFVCVRFLIEGHRTEYYGFKKI